MKRDSNPCPEPEVLAAFVEGNLSGAERDMTIEHLSECRDCRRIVAEAQRFETLSKELRAPQWTPRFPIWMAAAAAIAVVCIGIVWMVRTTRANAPVQTLVEAAPTDGRFLEARVSGGFPWAPLRPVARGSEIPTASQMKLVGAAGKVIEETSNDASVPARHAAAIARLLTGNAPDASAQLSTLAQTASDAAIWNDLAASRYAEAIQSDDEKSKLADALAAADAALRLQPKYAEALFNRALILERLGLREHARAAWNRYLEIDAASQWAEEARKHAAALTPVAGFSEALERTYTELRKNNVSAVAALVARHPQKCREWGESEILKRWAVADAAGDVANARVHLLLARTIGDELERLSGEMLLKDAVAAIDRAQPEQRRLIAAAHLRFNEAPARRKDGSAIAEATYREAAALFAQGGSPMAFAARYFAANMVFEQNQFDRAGTQLTEILHDCPPGYKANIAGVHWELAQVHAAHGRWGRALDALNTSIEGFEALRETHNAAFVREIASELYDRIGDPRLAWRERLAVLPELGRTGNMHLQVALYGVARAAALNRDWVVGLSFLDLQLSTGRLPNDEVMYAHTRLLRAMILERMGEHHAASEDLRTASAVIPSIKDPARRQRAESERFAVEGFLTRTPAEAVAALSRAIDFQRTQGRRMFLPELLLFRGRAYTAIGRQDAAEEDFEEGIREMENQRASLDAGDGRWGIFGSADELFDEAVSLALQKDETASAFAYSERARARELLDAMGTTFPATAAVPQHSDAVIVEYARLRDQLLVFVLDGTRLRAVKVKGSGTELSQEIAALTSSAESADTDEFRRHASALYDRLLGPVAEELAGDKTLVIVPDSTLANVPFAALVDPTGRFLIEQRPIVVTPSAAAFSRAAARTQRYGQRSRVLMIAGPTTRTGDVGSLAYEQKEIDAIAAEYHEVTRVRLAANDESLEQRARGRKILHFVGHAVLPDDTRGGALVVSRDDRLDVREIASMRFDDVGLVVLAACGTARAQGRSGESSISVARAFLTAGVPSVVATLWPVDDAAAADFFPRFHHYIAQGLPPSEALRAVQLEWIRRQDGSPGIWAAVQIIGT